MEYQPTWNSLKKHNTPGWFRKAKFGIYTHWGIYSVPACRPNATWYPFNMYRKGTEQYEYHKKTYGDPSKFGYKDFIPMFTGENFDADEWAELFRQSGAKFAGPVGEHHDGFTMWNSRINPWNAVNMGPRRDVVGELEKAIRAKDMRFMVALHHAENWWFFPHWMKEYDTSDPRFAGLYGEAHDLNRTENTPGTDQWHKMQKPSKAFLDQWLGKTKEVIDQYSPDLLWFDFGLEFIQEHYKREFLAYYFNEAARRNQDVVVAYKYHNLAVGSGVVDLELGRFDELRYHDWITDTTVDDGQGWGYLFDARYKTPTSLIHYLIDNVSKNGYMLLNVGPTPKGEIPEEAKEILRQIGDWLAVNEEAIFDTTPWMVYGEGPTKMQKAGPFNEDQELKYSANDFRFTCRDDLIYAICLGWPGNDFVIRSMVSLYPGEIKKITLLGDGKPLQWKLSEDGLYVERPEKKPCAHAYTLKIERQHPFR